MKVHQTSRILNDTKIGVLGLGIQDFLILIGIYGVSQMVFGLILKINTMFSILNIFIMTVVLIFVRNKYRKMIIRDYLKFSYNKITRCGVWYDKAHKRD